MGVFLSYSWDSETHRNWVLELSKRLRVDGIESVLDQWHAIPGDNLPKFMETAIRENDFVIIICTPKYKQKADNSFKLFKLTRLSAYLINLSILSKN